MTEQNNKRTIYLTKEINSETIMPIVQQIYTWNEEDAEKEKTLKEFVRQPIRIFLNTPGGECYETNALRDAIQLSITPVYTIATGKCMSGGLHLLVVGHKRFITPAATLMFHGASGGASGKSGYCKQEYAELERLQNIYMLDIIRNSKVTDKMLGHYISNGGEWYISASEALELKLVDEYYSL